MSALAALACLAMGLVIGYGVASKNLQNSPPSPTPEKASARDTPVSVESPASVPPKQVQAADEATPNDPVFEDMKIVLIGLLNTLNTAIAHLQEGSSKYEEQLDLHRAALKETLRLTDLHRLAAELVHQVETMYTVNAQYREQINEANTLVEKQQADIEELQLKSGTDFLTNLANRSAYNDRIKEMTNIARRYGNIFSLLVMDIDHFKSVNDSHGHIGGDTILRDVAKLLKEFSRAGDFLARYGGEEFVYILPETNSEQAGIMSENLRKRIEEAKFTFNEEEIPITVSGGIATILPGKETGGEVFARADKALYNAKEKGRNRIETSTE